MRSLDSGYKHLLRDNRVNGEKSVIHGRWLFHERTGDVTYAGCAMWASGISCPPCRRWCTRCPACVLSPPATRAPCNPDTGVDPEEHVSGEHEIRDRDEHRPPDHHSLQEFPGPILGWGKRRRIFAYLLVSESGEREGAHGCDGLLYGLLQLNPHPMMSASFSVYIGHHSRSSLTPHDRDFPVRTQLSQTRAFTSLKSG